MGNRDVRTSVCELPPKERARPSRKGIRLDITEEKRKEWNRLGRIIVHFLEANTEGPVEGYIVLESVRNFLRDNFEECNFHVASEYEMK